MRLLGGGGPIRLPGSSWYPSSPEKASGRFEDKPASALATKGVSEDRREHASDNSTNSYGARGKQDFSQSWPSSLETHGKRRYARIRTLVRRYVSIQVLLALVPAVFSAPFLHLHWQENSGHFMRVHRAQALVTHTHFSICGCWRGRGENVTMSADH